MQKGFSVIFFTFLIGIILVLVIAGAMYVALNNYNKDESRVVTSKDLKPSNSPSLIASPTSPASQIFQGWKEFEDEKFSFKYPDNFFIKETDNNFYVLLDSPDQYPSNATFSVDARLDSDNSSFEKAINKIKEGLLDIKVSNLERGIKISGKLKGPAYEGVSISTVLLRYRDGAIVIENSRGIISEELFDQIVGSFEIK